MPLGSRQNESWLGVEARDRVLPLPRRAPFDGDDEDNRQRRSDRQRHPVRSRESIACAIGGQNRLETLLEQRTRSLERRGVSIESCERRPPLRVNRLQRVLQSDEEMLGRLSTNDGGDRRPRPPFHYDRELADA